MGWFDEDDAVRGAFERELVASQRLRALAFVVVLAVVDLIVIVSGLLGVLAPPLYEPAYGLSIYHWAAALVSVAVLYELFVWRALRGRDAVPRVFPYVTTFVEMLLPTGVLLAFATVIDPGQAIGAPPLLFYALLIVLAALHVDERVCLFAGATAAALYLVLYLHLIAGYHGPASGTFLVEPAPHFIRAALLAVIGVAAAFVTRDIKKRIRNSFESRAEQQRVFALLGEQVSAPVAEALLREGGVGRVHRVCVMFLDIRGFTRFAENRTPEQTVAFLNQLFAPMIETVNAHDGVINKFLGDGFMAIFGPPFTAGNPSEAAVAAARELLEQLPEDGPEIGIGLHTGEAVTGNIGSELRREYTVIGDVVNLASRIEGLNKEYGSRLLMSADTWNDLANPPAPLRTVEAVAIKGRDEPIALYQLA